MKKYPLILIAFLLIARIAAPYTRITSVSGDSPKWPAMPIPIWVNQGGSPQISNGSDFAAVQAALKTWQNVAGADVQFKYLGPTAAQNVGYDGINLITFADQAAPLGSSTIAATFSFYTVAGSTVVFSETDISFNPTLDFSTSAEAGKFDIQGVLTHELGHVLGLDHSAMLSSVMTPYSQASQLDQRTLSYDDIAGVSEIYPKASSTPPVGQIQGSVLQGVLGVFGAHVVAVDQNGTAWVSTLSQPTGSYLIHFVPPGTYRVYAEPLDLPVTEQNVGGGWYTGLNTNFGTTYFGDVADLASAATIQVAPGPATSLTNIHVLPAGTSGLNLTRPALGVRIARDATQVLTAGGAGLTPDTLFASSNPGLTLGLPNFGGPISSVAATSAAMNVTVASTAALGPTNLTAQLGGDSSLLTGAVVVVDHKPAPLFMSPTSGPVAGGTDVTISGFNFRTGLSVYFGGLAASNVSVVDSTMLRATSPDNVPGAANVVIVNSDGTNGFIPSAFDYVPPTPAIAGVSPGSGPPTTVVTITGQQFDPHPGNLDVEFNGVSSRVISASPTQIVAVVPYGATSGAVTVSSFGVASTGDAFFNVTTLPLSSNTAPDSNAFTDLTTLPSASTLQFNGVNPNDDGLANVQLPFAFSLFNDIYLAGSSITVSTNGWLSLEPVADPYSYQNGPLPGTSATDYSGIVRAIPPSLVAPFYDDLSSIPSVSSISTAVLGSAPNRQFVVEWSKLTILNEVGADLNANITFEAILYEGTNDIQFVYPSLNGTRSDGSSATIGIQNLTQDRAVMTSFNQPRLSSGYFVTYHFNQGAYAAQEGLPLAPAAPVVTDGGAVTADGTELFATWLSQGGPAAGLRYQYSVFESGSASSVTQVVPPTLTSANSALIQGLKLDPGGTYYFSVIAISSTGLKSSPGMSDGIRYDPAFQPDVKTIPYGPENGAQFSGLALLAPSAMYVVLKAMDIKGNLITGPGVFNPVTVTLASGQQSARLVNELFGLSTFDGWIQAEASAAGLGVYTATGNWDMSSMDGSVPLAAAADFVLFHPGATAFLLNPTSNDANVTLTDIATSGSQTFTVTAGSRLAVMPQGISRIQSSVALAAVDTFNVAGELAIGEAAPVSAAQTSLVIPDAVVGGGYATTLSLANISSSAIETRISFGGVSRAFSFAPNSVLRTSLADFLQIPSGAMVSDAIRVDSSASPFGSPPAALLGNADIENAGSAVSLRARPPASDFTFPQVANGNGLFTGLCMATGNNAASITIEVYGPTGGTPKSATLFLGANRQIAKLINELVTSVGTQIGGYIRIHSDQPVWAWEIYGSDRIMASGPPN